ncbi:MAG: SCO family protein, partial [Verrucomicrobiota bacterium]
MKNEENSASSEPAVRGTLWIIGAIVLLGFVVTWNYVYYTRARANESGPPNIKALETDLSLIDHEGNPRRLSELRGKIWILGYVFTACPAGCLGLTATMRDLQAQYGDDSDYHFVSISMDPERDRPDVLKAWMDKVEVGGDNWWFLTGDEKAIRKYMAKYFQLQVTERTDPEEIKAYGRWEHKNLLVSVDRRGMIRGYYDVLHFDSGDLYLDKLKKDLKTL